MSRDNCLIKKNVWIALTLVYKHGKVILENFDRFPWGNYSESLADIVGTIARQKPGATRASKKFLICGIIKGDVTKTIMDSTALSGNHEFHLANSLSLLSRFCTWQILRNVAVLFYFILFYIFFFPLLHSLPPLPASTLFLYLFPWNFSLNNLLTLLPVKNLFAFIIIACVFLFQLLFRECRGMGEASTILSGGSWDQH